MGRGVVEHPVEHVRGDDVTSADGVEGVERDEHHGPVGVVERRRDDLRTMFPRHRRCSTDEGRPPGRAVALERGHEVRHGRVAELSERDGGAARRARVVDGSDHETDHVVVGGIVRLDGIERGCAHLRALVVQQCDELRAQLGGRPRVSTRGERGERTHAHLGVGVLRQLPQLGRGRGRHGAGEQIEAEAHVAYVVGPEQGPDRGVVPGEVEAAGRERATPHFLAERAGVRPIHADGDGRPHDREHEAEDDHRARPEAEEIQGEQQHAGGADRDRDADALDHGLDGESFLDRDHLVRRVDRRAGRAVRRRDVGDPEHAREHEEPVRGGAGPRDDHGHGGEHDRDGGGVQHQPEAEPEPPHQRAGEEREEEDVGEVERGRVPGEEPREVVAAVLRRRAVEQEEVDDPRAHRRQHLVHEQQQGDARGEERPQGWARDRRGRRRPARREPPGSAARSRAAARGRRAARRWSRGAGARSSRAGPGAGSRAGRPPGSRRRSRRRCGGTAPSSDARRAAGRPGRR